MSKTNIKPSPNRILPKIWKFVLPFKKLFALSLLLNFCFSTFSVLSITLIRPVIDIIFNASTVRSSTENSINNSDIKIINNNLDFLSSVKDDFFNWIGKLIETNNISDTLLRFGLLIVVVFLIKNIFKFLSNIVNCRFEESVIKNIRDSVFTKINSLSLDFFNRNKLGNLMSIITNDVSVVNQTTINAVTVIIREGLQIILFIALLFSISMQLTLTTFSAGILILGIIRIAIKYLKKYASRMQQAMADFTGTMSEIISGIRVVKAFVAEKIAVKRFKNDTNYYVKSSIKHTKITSLVPILSEISAILALVVVLVRGGILITEGSLSSADLMLFLFALFSIMAPIINVANQIAMFPRGIVAAERIFSILDAKASVKDGNIKVNTFNYSIELRNVSFKYNENYVLRNINLIIKKGKQIALVGSSGSGKTTILDLIIRFYDVTEGEILLDGVNIKQLKINNYRKLFGLVSQENILFNDTISNNITYGLESNNYTEADVINAARISNCYNFIENMPEKFNSHLGDRGSTISGGERQRISIARALLRNPDILMFDEATSALDVESEKLVQSAINNSLENKTAIIVAHRLSTVVNCDEIIVFSQGEIVERGSHSQLLEKQGHYEHLYNLQHRHNAP